MKIKPVHYEELRKLTSPYFTSKERRLLDTITWFVWDAFWSIPEVARSNLSNVLYSYLKDSHIETALRAIYKEATP